MTATRVWPRALDGARGYVAQAWDRELGAWVEVGPARKRMQEAENDRMRWENGR